MDNWVIIVVAGIVCVTGLSIGLPMLVGLISVIMEHRKEMADIKAKKKAAPVDQDRLSAEYQEFVLGVDSRIQKLEERIRLLEARLRQSGDSGDDQQVRRG